MDPLQFLVHANARLGLSFQLGNDLVLLLLDVVLKLLLRHFELVLGLKRDHHAAEVLSNEVLDELLARVAIRDLTLGKDFICDVCTRLERQLLREDEGVIAVQQDLVDLHEDNGLTEWVQTLRTTVGQGMVTLGMMADMEMRDG